MIIWKHVDRTVCIRGAVRSGLLMVLIVLAIPLTVLAAGTTADARDPQAAKVDLERFADSVHGEFDCMDCHMQERDMAISCGTCHDAEAQQYEESVHGTARHEGLALAPACQNCHGDIHTLKPLSDAESPVNPRRLPDTCGACHSDPKLSARMGMPRARPIEAYEASVHARGVEKGEKNAICSDCHGSHAIFPPRDRRSQVNHWKVPETCGACHKAIATAYKASVHGQASSKGVRESPVCTDCHGEHRILSPSERGSPVFASNIPKMTCGQCHGDLRLERKFGLSTHTVPAYEDSYHGLAVRSGALHVAQCASCHGVHDILRSSDPGSHTNKKNLSTTCGKCHPGAGTTFAISSVHSDPAGRTGAMINYVRLFYIWLICLVVPAMFVHNLLDLLRKARSSPDTLPSVALDTEERMQPGFRIAHAALMVSFVVLAYTGFSLKYPESWWARPVLHWEELFALRGWIHRAAAIALLAAIGFHLIHLKVDRRARACIAGMRPRWEDWVEFKQRVAYLLGLRKEPPPGRRIGYAEKVEYIALMWGMVIMSLTGVVLWFVNLSLRWLPKWITDLSTAVHFYEAVLATLAILVWHLYFVLFDPLVYPMDTAWLTGRSPQARDKERQSHSSSAGTRGSVQDRTDKKAG